MAALCGAIASEEAIGTPKLVGKILAAGAIASAEDVDGAAMMRGTIHSEV